MTDWEDVARKSTRSETVPMPWVRHFSPEAGKTILELGCHKGANLLTWANQGFRCHGQDISQTCIDIFNSNNSFPAATAETGPAEDFETDELWDYVVMASMLESVEDPLRVLQAASKALSPNGEIYIATLRKWWRPPIRTQKRIIEAPMLRQWLKKAGLKMGNSAIGGKQQQWLICWAYHE